MNMGKVVAVLLVLAAFAAGMQFGKKSGGSAPLVTSASEGAAYGGSTAGKATEEDVAAARDMILHVFARRLETLPDERIDAGRYVFEASVEDLPKEDPVNRELPFAVEDEAD